MAETAIIIPAYNEAATIGDTLAQFRAEFAEARIVVVDNNSSDGTGELARGALARLGGDGVVMSEPRQGKANAVRRAFREIDADIFILVDADMTYPAREVKKLLGPVLNGSADMAVGDRLSGGHYGRENKRPFHNFGNALVGFLVNRLFGAKLRDIMSGARVFSRTFVKNYPILCSGFEIETEMTLHALDKRFAIVEIPIEYKDRPAGSFSKLNTFSDGARVIKTIFSILKNYRPFLFFSGCAAVFSVLGLVAGLPPIIEFMRFHYVYKVPLAILATGLMIFSLLCFSVGLILDTIAKIHRHDYELKLLNPPPPLRLPPSTAEHK
ncbi:MAG: glycosyltransferase family 2 protein [Elusimicrobiales bacterium]